MKDTLTLDDINRAKAILAANDRCEREPLVLLRREFKVVFGHEPPADAAPGKVLIVCGELIVLRD